MLKKCPKNFPNVRTKLGLLGQNVRSKFQSSWNPALGLTFGFLFNLIWRLCASLLDGRFQINLRSSCKSTLQRVWYIGESLFICWVSYQTVLEKILPNLSSGAKPELHHSASQTAEKYLHSYWSGSTRPTRCKHHWESSDNPGSTGYISSNHQTTESPMLNWFKLQADPNDRVHQEINH